MAFAFAQNAEQKCLACASALIRTWRRLGVELHWLRFSSSDNDDGGGGGGRRGEMKAAAECRELMKNPLAIRITAIALACLAFFYIGKHWSDGYPQQLLFFRGNAGAAGFSPSGSSVVVMSPNANRTFNISALIASANGDQSLTPPTTDPNPLASPSPPPPPPQPERYGILDGNGTMKEDFNVGRFDPDLVENWGEGRENVTENGDEDASGGTGGSVKLQSFPLCSESMREYIPCLDNEEEINNLKSWERGEKYERHCPGKDKAFNCLVPAPKDYRTPIPWPKSRDEVWFSNVPHARLVEDKGGQNWIAKINDKFTFPGGGTQFIHGADKYLDQISEMVPEIAFGQHTRVVLDVGCGVASFGAYLLSRNVITMSIAPKDVHENQIQFALERGVPAMVAAFATHRLLYPSQAFDLIHCSRCRINWTRDGMFIIFSGQS
ncbi:hypothetical protein Taro_037949 [Colocasia esculenta]|uniref:Methyltransferase n=1 Tax=Colocasia esculenta TaxID=4460 RepID=A0A843WHR4_COLES|nr:hypothetical protein [Colocasia esculenta]